MHKSQITAIAAFAVLAMAAFAGVAVLADDTDAESTTYSVSYVVGSTTVVKTYTDSVTLATLVDLGVQAPAGYDFMGWYVADSESPEAIPTTTYAAGSIYNIAEGTTVTLTAYLKEITYTVTFVGDDGKVVKEFKDQKYDAEIVVPTLPKAVEGKVAVGWTLDGELVSFTDSKMKVTADAKYVASYADDIVLSFVVDGTTMYTHYMTGLVYPDDPAKPDFEFMGWAVDGKTVLLADATMDALVALKLDKDTVFNAVFEPMIHTVTFVSEGVTVLTQTVKHGELATMPATVPVKDGYDFAGWDFDFTKAINADTEIVALFTLTPEPEKEGMDDPIIASAVIGVIVVLCIALALAYIRRDSLPVKLTRNPKQKNDDRPKEGDGQA